MSIATDDVVNDVERILRAGFEEMTTATRDEFEPFVRDFAPMIADLSVRAAMDDKAALVTLEMVKQQALTHAFIARLHAAGVANSQLQSIIGIAVRIVMGVL